MNTIFGENIGGFLKNQCYDQIFEKTNRLLSKKRKYLSQFFREKIFKIITSDIDVYIIRNTNSVPEKVIP
jgi:hypothetical protein